MTDIETHPAPRRLGLPAEHPATWLARAEAEGLVDVAYASVDSPLGPLLVATTPKGLVRVAYSEFRSPDEVLEDLAGAHLAAGAGGARRGSTPCAASSTSTSPATARGFDLPDRLVAPRGVHPRRAARDGTDRLRPDRAPTRRWRRARAARVRCGPPATRSGPTRCRWSSPATGCSRTGGALGGYTGGVERKEFLLRLEGAQL